VAVALIFDKQMPDANEPILVVAQWGDKIDKVKELTDQIVRKAVEDGARRQTEDYRSVDITTIEKNPTDALNYCFIDDCLLRRPELLFHRRLPSRLDESERAEIRYRADKRRRQHNPRR